MSKDVKEIIIDAKKGKGKIAEILGSQTENMAKELERAQMERILEEEKQKLLKLRQQQGAPLQVGQATNFLQNLFTGRSPEEIKEILSSLAPEDIDKIVAMNNNAFSDLRNLARSPSSDSKTVLEAVKTGVEVAKAQSNQGVDLKGIAEIFKAGVEAARVQNPAQPQQNVYETLVKTTLDELKATREQMATQEKLRIEKEIAELKARPSGIDELLFNEEKATRARKIFGGTDSATANEFTLRKEEMQQKERLENRKLDWEMQQHQEDKEGEKQLYALIGKAIDGPIADLTKSVGGAAAKRIEGGGGRRSNTPAITQISCPNCQTSFDIITGSQQVICPSCKAVMQLETQPQRPQTQEQPPVMSPQETQAPPQASEVQQPTGDSQTEQQPNQQ